MLSVLGSKHSSEEAYMCLVHKVAGRWRSLLIPRIPGNSCTWEMHQNHGKWYHISFFKGELVHYTTTYFRLSSLKQGSLEFKLPHLRNWVLQQIWAISLNQVRYNKYRLNAHSHGGYYFLPALLVRPRWPLWSTPYTYHPRPASAWPCPWCGSRADRADTPPRCVCRRTGARTAASWCSSGGRAPGSRGLSTHCPPGACPCCHCCRRNGTCPYYCPSLYLKHITHASHYKITIRNGMCRYCCQWLYLKHTYACKYKMTIREKSCLFPVTWP